MKRIITTAVGALGAAAAYFVLSALPAFSAETSTVNAKVTVASPCITISLVGGATELNFGVQPLATPANNANSSNFGTLVTSCSPSTQNVTAKGTDATGGAALWSLTDSSSGTSICGLGKNRYSIRLEPVEKDTSTIKSLGPALVLSSQSSKPVYAPAAGAEFVPQTNLFMPCSGSDGAGQTMSFQIIYTASL
jgi:hypothetical protein